jgi:hypothetical protein
MILQARVYDDAPGNSLRIQKDFKIFEDRLQRPAKQRKRCFSMIVMIVAIAGT